jgi:hypothetical protein
MYYRFPLTLLALIVLAQVPPTFAFPTGLVSLSPGCSPVATGVLNNPYVSIVGVRCGWERVEKTAGTYNWSYFDAQIAAAAAVHKPVLLRVVAGGYHTPSYVYAKGARTFTFTETTSYNYLYQKSVTIPLFWDSVFLSSKFAMIAKMGQHFASNPNVEIVAVSCANATTDDWEVPHSSADISNWHAVGYTSAQMVTACEQTIDATIAAFPTQYVTLAIGQDGTLDSPQSSTYVADSVTAYAISKYPSHVIIQKNGLSATTPDPNTTRLSGSWLGLYDARPDIAAQNLWFVTNDLTCRMNAGVKPCQPTTMLDSALSIGRHYGIGYAEIYDRDILNPALQATLSQYATTP